MMRNYKGDKCPICEKSAEVGESRKHADWCRYSMLLGHGGVDKGHLEALQTEALFRIAMALEDMNDK